MLPKLGCRSIKEHLRVSGEVEKKPKVYDSFVLPTQVSTIGTAIAMYIINGLGCAAGKMVKMERVS